MKMRIYLTIISAWLLFLSNLGSATGQCMPDDVLVRINGYSISCSDFKIAFLKNNSRNHLAGAESVENYLELYINFRLKVLEALSLGLDTSASFRSEFAGYRQQLANSFLTDRQVTDRLLKEAYERLQYDIRASHILISVGRFASPSDTLAAWNRIMQARERILNGEPFEVVAREVSDDPSARDRQASATTPPISGNGGDLGFFTALDMVYPFETAAYNSPVGQVSLPVRTAFGYHIIKVTDRLHAMGLARVAHIMKIVQDWNDLAHVEISRKEIFALYERILVGETFEDLVANYSDDRGSASHQGEIPPFSSNRIVPEFVKAISKLDSPGEISTPVRTRFGYHLLKLIEKTPPPTFDEIAFDLSHRIQADERSKLSQQVVIDRLKLEYDFKENPDALSEIAKLIDQTVFEGNWNKCNEVQMNGTLFSFANQIVPKQEFIYYITENQQPQNPVAIETFVGYKYQEFVNEKILTFEKSKLESKNPEFRQIIQEYRDGMLLFELQDKRVWSKALMDTVGLKEFFLRYQSLYYIPAQMQASIYSFAERGYARVSRRQIRSALHSGKNLEQIGSLLEKASIPGFEKRAGVFAKDQESLFQLIRHKNGLSKVVYHEGRYFVAVIWDVFPPKPQLMSAVRGKVIADYQTYLEEKWVEELREKYQVKINTELLNKLKISNP